MTPLGLGMGVLLVLRVLNGRLRGVDDDLAVVLRVLRLRQLLCLDLLCLNLLCLLELLLVCAVLRAVRRCLDVDGHLSDRVLVGVGAGIQWVLALVHVVGEQILVGPFVVGVRLVNFPYALERRRLRLQRAL